MLARTKSLSYTDGRNAKWYATLENSLAVAFKMKPTTA